MSQLVVVDFDGNETLPFPTLARESLTCLNAFAERSTEFFNIRQYGYYPEFGATIFEMLIDWGTHQSPPPARVAELGEVLVPTPLQAALKKLTRQYEIVLDANLWLVSHEGRLTRCKFKPNGEYKDPPADLSWMDLEPPLRELV